MRARKTTVFVLSLVGLILATWVMVGQTRRIDDLALKNAGKTGEEWLTYGMTPGETRYSPLKQIDTTNVSRLGLAWLYEVGSGGGNQEGTPLFWNGNLYAITNWSVVYSVDARTGKERWRWDPEVNQTAVRPKICCGVVNRGIAIYQGKIIAPVIDGRLQALDAETGKPVWEARVAFPQDNYTVTMAPRIAKGKVIVGVSGAEYPVRGFFAAYDANTGQLAWRFYTIPGDPSKPFERPELKKAAETWSGDWWKLGGGGTVWDGVAYDPDTNLVFVGTGNGGPWPEELRKSKGKDNLFVCSILAVNADTGDLKWYYQNTPGDSWDFDSVQGFILADVTINGRPRKIIMQANKNGFYYVLDRLTGSFISAQPFAAVTWAKGIDPETGRPIINPEAHYDNGGGTVTVQPAADTTGRRCRTTLVPAWFTFPQRRRAAARTRSIRTLRTPPGDPTRDCSAVIVAVVALRQQVIIVARPQSNRQRRHRLCRPSGRLRLKANAVCSSPGIRSLRKNGGEHPAEEESAVEPSRRLGISCFKSSTMDD
jgi:quinohemoprotein ethanol dehydrogenase